MVNGGGTEGGHAKTQSTQRRGQRSPTPTLPSEPRGSEAGEDERAQHGAPLRFYHIFG